MSWQNITPMSEDDGIQIDGEQDYADNFQPNPLGKKPSTPAAGAIFRKGHVIRTLVPKHGDYR
jgi:hypothetical protein